MKKFSLAVLLILLTVSVGADELMGTAPFLNSTFSKKALSPVFSVFRQIAILDEGRIKPLDTYSRNILLQFSGKRTFDRKPAIEWLAKLIFTPEQTLDDKVFLINSPEIAAAIGIPPQAHRRYSFRDLELGLDKLHKLAVSVSGIEARNRSLVDEEIVRVAHNVDAYISLSSAMSFTRAQEEFSVGETDVRAMLELPAGEKNFSFLDIALKADRLLNATQSLETKNSANWSPTEKAMMQLMRQLYDWSVQHQARSALTIIPPYEPNDETWFSPGELLPHLAHEEVRVQLAALKGMADAYRNGEPILFDLSIKNLNSTVQRQVGKRQAKAIAKIPLELFYNQTNLFRWAWILYFLAFFVFLFALIWPTKFPRTLGFLLLACGFVPHALALGLRIAIMARPPVTNLYETFIFVGAISALLSLIIEKFNKNWLGIVVGSICGVTFLSIADKFSAEGDTMRMLVAVLDSNFWLATHVLSITIGYAGCSVAAVLGHVYIVQALTKAKEKVLDTTYRYILGALGFGLTMSFLGTMLGGIWADQSWGRFWGWDPKENGALLIVLWTAMLFHAKAGRMLNPLGIAVGSALGLVVVMWAWFGVNLLSVGLHSYGFTSGLAFNLSVYVILEVLFLLVSSILLGKKRFSV